MPLAGTEIKILDIYDNDRCPSWTSANYCLSYQIKVDENGKIVDAKFKTFGCGSAIASSSLATEWIKGKSVSSN